MHRPQSTPSRHQSLESLTLISTLILITSFLVLLMMLWHLSTAHLFDKYGMPADWVHEFLHSHFPPWRIALWVGLFVVIPLNILHALLALDFYAGRVYPRGRGPAPSISLNKASSEMTSPADCASTVLRATGRPDPCHSTLRSASAQHPASSAASRPPPPSPLPKFPKTHHPFLRPSHTPYPRFLHTIYDALLLTLLLLHIVTFVTSIRPKYEECDHVPPEPLATLPAYWDPTDPEQQIRRPHVSYRDRCVRINIDSWISGGFDVAMCVLLTGLHAWVLGCRLVGSLRSRVTGKERKKEEEGIEMGSLDLEGGKGAETETEHRERVDDGESRAGEENQGPRSASSPVALPTTSTPARKAARRRRREPSSGMGSGAGSKWTQVAFECLIGDP